MISWLYHLFSSETSFNNPRINQHIIILNAIKFILKALHQRQGHMVYKSIIFLHSKHYQLSSMLSHRQNSHTSHSMQHTGCCKVQSREFVKPIKILPVEYDKHIGTIGRSDMMITSTEFIWKSLKQLKNLIFHLFDLALLNSQTVYSVKTVRNI